MGRPLAHPRRQNLRDRSRVSGNAVDGIVGQCDMEAYESGATRLVNLATATSPPHHSITWCHAIYGTSRRDHSGLMLANSITSLQFSVSSAISLPKSAEWPVKLVVHLRHACRSVSFSSDGRLHRRGAPIGRRSRDRPNSRYQLAGLRHISGHEYGQCDLEAFEHALVKVGELGRALD
jgi:hypothetical protein